MKLEKAAHAFVYRCEYEEPGCRGHNQGITNWELGRTYRS